IRDLTVTGVQTCALPIFDRPYLERWYHFAAVHSGNTLDVFIDGHRRTWGVNVGDCSNAEGVSIGGLSNSNFIYGEVQELAIYQRSEERRVGKECRSRWWP